MTSPLLKLHTNLSTACSYVSCRKIFSSMKFICEDISSLLPSCGILIAIEDTKEERDNLWHRLQKTRSSW